MVIMEIYYCRDYEMNSLVITVLASISLESMIMGTLYYNFLGVVLILIKVVRTSWELFPKFILQNYGLDVIITKFIQNTLTLKLLWYSGENRSAWSKFCEVCIELSIFIWKLVGLNFRFYIVMRFFPTFTSLSYLYRSYFILPHFGIVFIFILFQLLWKLTLFAMETS